MRKEGYSIDEACERMKASYLALERESPGSIFDLRIVEGSTGKIIQGEFSYRERRRWERIAYDYGLAFLPVDILEYQAFNKRLLVSQQFVAVKCGDGEITRSVSLLREGTASPLQREFFGFRISESYGLPFSFSLRERAPKEYVFSCEIANPNGLVTLHGDASNQRRSINALSVSSSYLIDFASRISEEYPQILEEVL